MIETYTQTKRGTLKQHQKPDQSGFDRTEVVLTHDLHKVEPVVRLV